MNLCKYTGQIKVGDLIRRKIKRPSDAKIAESTGLFGMVVSREMSGNPKHPCIKVLYPKSGKVYLIAESLVEVVND